jgi:hypothetical protein
MTIAAKLNADVFEGATGSKRSAAGADD